jgi:hypothetical protein
MARTIAANAAYPSVGHIPLRRELDDATGMGAERLIIDGKARTASASRDRTAFSAEALSVRRGGAAPTLLRPPYGCLGRAHPSRPKPGLKIGINLALAVASLLSGLPADLRRAHGRVD